MGLEEIQASKYFCKICFLIETESKDNFNLGNITLILKSSSLINLKNHLYDKHKLTKLTSEKEIYNLIKIEDNKITQSQFDELVLIFLIDTNQF